jgi:hypothetical protein
MKKKILILYFSILYFSCQTNKVCIDSRYYVVIYKFLYNNDYPFPQTEKSFWLNGNDSYEFSIYKYKGLDEKQLLSFIYSQKKAQPENNSNNIFWYNYSFVFPNKDTIYSNERLDEWKVKRNGNRILFRSIYKYSGRKKRIM